MAWVHVANNQLINFEYSIPNIYIYIYSHNISKDSSFTSQNISLKKIKIENFSISEDI